MTLPNKTETHAGGTTTVIDPHNQNQTENLVEISLPLSQAAQQTSSEEATTSLPKTTTDKYDRWHAWATSQHNKTHTHIEHVRTQIEVCVSNVAERDETIEDLKEGLSILRAEKEEKERDIQEAQRTIQFCVNRIQEIDIQLSGGGEQTETTTIPTLQRQIRALQKQSKDELTACKAAEVARLRSERISLIRQKREAEWLVQKNQEKTTEYKEKIKKWRAKHKQAVTKRKKADQLINRLTKMISQTHNTTADTAAYANATISTNKHTRRSVSHSRFSDINEGGHNKAANMEKMNYTAIRGQIEETYASIMKKLSFNRALQTACGNGTQQDDLAATLEHIRKSNLSHGITNNESHTNHPISNGLDQLTMQNLSAVCSGVIGTLCSGALGTVHATALDNNTESSSNENMHWNHVMMAAAAGMGIGVAIQPVVAYIRNTFTKNRDSVENTGNQEHIRLMAVNPKLAQDVSSFDDGEDGLQLPSSQSDVFVQSAGVIQQFC